MQCKRSQSLPQSFLREFVSHRKAVPTWQQEPSSGSATRRASASSPLMSPARTSSSTTSRFRPTATAPSPRARRCPTTPRPATRAPRPSTSSRSRPTGLQQQYRGPASAGPFLCPGFQSHCPSLEGMSDTTGPRSVKIGADERSGWSSDRPRGDRPPRPVDISTRCRILKPTDRMRYSPGSLVIVVSAATDDANKFAARVFEEQGAVLGVEKLKGMLQGRVPDEALENTAVQLLDKTVASRLEKGEAVVLVASTLSVDEREPYVRAAHKLRRPRHLVLL